MIYLFTGNVGSGKTLNAVRHILSTPHIDTYTNIVFKRKRKNVHRMKSEHFIKDMVIGQKKVGGELQDIKKPVFNAEFWVKQQEKPLNVVIDEVHNVMNARNFASKENKIMTEFFALIRKVLTGFRSTHGVCIATTQTPRKADVILREGASVIVKHRCYWIKECRKCKFRFVEDSEKIEEVLSCPKCNYYYFKEYGHKVHIAKYRPENITLDNHPIGAPESQMVLNSPEKIFNIYDTYQISDLWGRY